MKKPAPFSIFPSFVALFRTPGVREVTGGFFTKPKPNTPQLVVPDGTYYHLAHFDDRTVVPVIVQTEPEPRKVITGKLVQPTLGELLYAKMYPQLRVPADNHVREVPIGFKQRSPGRYSSNPEDARFPSQLVRTLFDSSIGYHYHVAVTANHLYEWSDTGEVMQTTGQPILKLTVRDRFNDFEIVRTCIFDASRGR